MKKVLCVKADWKMPDGSAFMSGPEVGDIDTAIKQVSTHECGIDTLTIVNGYVLARFPGIVFKCAFFVDVENIFIEHPELMKDARINLLLTQIFN